MSATPSSRLRKPSRRWMALFHLYLRWYLGRHFHGLRVAHPERFPRTVDGPLVVYLNHPSWWDPLTCILVSRAYLPYANHYAPMEEAALRRYRFFARLGLFPVEPNTTRGAVQFVRQATAILTAGNSVLWMTPQGRFADAREHPLQFKAGLASLLAKFPQATVVPLAIEYTLWDERLPEILVNCGMAIPLDPTNTRSASQWEERLTGALSAAQQELAALVISRDPKRFTTLLEGAAGIGSMYDLWQRMRSRFNGEAYEPEHGSIQRP